MKLNMITIWALSATALALVLGGVLIGQALNQTAVASAPSSTQPDGEAVIDPYQVPDWLSDAPTEWRTEFSQSYAGYAILFDYLDRRLLVEQCQHNGFFDVDANRPVEQPGLNCNRVLTARLIEFVENGVLVQRKNGEQSIINLAPLNNNGLTKLQLEFDDHTMALIPGQPNDLVQEVDNTDQIRVQKRRLFEFQNQQARQQRAQLAAMADDRQQQDSLPEGVPRFTLPATAAPAPDDTQ